MLLLCSNGLSSKNLLKAMSKRVKNCKTAALVVTADNEYKENNYHVDRCAAAFVFGPTLELVNMYSADMNFMGLTDLSGLNLTNIEVLPHYEKFLKRFDAFEEKCRIYEKEHSVEVIRLNDGDGVLIDGNNIEMYNKETEYIKQI
ncbi:MAG: Type 1 glutamine amidotransferase-like domain-containing protein [Butyrivibrio sp.]|nr:Type 1 glutamine amidotransferase-like domain-containing protein [Butyrivibrio sp.]